MAFYRHNRENETKQPIEKRQTKFQVSEKSFRKATVISSLTITILILILFIVRAVFKISEIDIQTICEVTAGLSAFALAIPLFLKDFDVTSTFWKQFYLIAITFFIGTFIGIISLLQISSEESKEIILYLWFFFSILISVNIDKVIWLGNKLKFNITLNPIINLLISYFFLLVSLIFSKGNFLIYSTIVFTIYGFYLTLTLMLSVLVELLFLKPKKNNDLRIKKAIQQLVEKYKEIAFDEQMLLDHLRAEVFPNEQEIVSRAKIQKLVIEMDFETEDYKPKITIFECNKIIPRWRKEYHDILSFKLPRFIFLQEERVNWGRKSLEFDIPREIDTLINRCKERTGLSYELFKDNILLMEHFYTIKVGVINYCNDGDSEDEFHFLCLAYKDLDLTKLSIINENDCVFFNYSTLKSILFKNCDNEIYTIEEIESEKFYVNNKIIISI